MKDPNCTCAYCETRFWRKPFAIKRYTLHFCNKKCRGNYAKQQNPKIEKVCKKCGKIILKTNSELRSSKRGLYFCNNECKNTYIGGKKFSSNPKSHRKVKESFLEAVKHQCQRCGYNEDIRMLDIHHYDGNHHNNEWDNLRCCCVWCHNLYHRCGVELDLPIVKDQRGVAQLG